MGAAARPTRAAAADGWLWRELGATLALGWPIILANIAINVMTATDFMMLGRLSPHALAAGSVGFFLYQPLFLLGIGVVAALSPIAAAKIGGRAEPGRAEARDPPGAPLRSLRRRRRVDRSDLGDAVPSRHRRAGGRRPGRRRLPSGIPVGPGAEPAVFCRAFGVCGARTPPSGAGRGPGRRRVQCARQLRADLRQARHAGPRDHSAPVSPPPCRRR